MNKTLLKTVLLILIVICTYCIYKWFVYKDAFINIVLNDVLLPETPTPELLTTLSRYDCYFNTETNTNLRNGADLAEQLLTRNQTKNQDKMSAMYRNIDDSLDTLNYNLLTQIQKNYYDAHKLNVERENNKTRLSQLPLRNL